MLGGVRHVELGYTLQPVDPSQEKVYRRGTTDSWSSLSIALSTSFLTLSRCASEWQVWLKVLQESDMGVFCVLSALL